MQAPTSFQFLRGTDQVYDSDTDSENILFAPHFGGKKHYGYVPCIYLYTETCLRYDKGSLNRQRIFMKCTTGAD